MPMAIASTTFDVSFTDVAPTVAADNASVTVPENQAASNSGTFSDYDDAVTVSASSGSVTPSGGGWSWSGSGDEDHPYTVTITATNTDGNSASTTLMCPSPTWHRRWRQTILRSLPWSIRQRRTRARTSITMMRDDWR